MASFVNVAPDLVDTASADLANIRSTLSQAAASAAAPTTGLLPAAADEVSAAISQLFGTLGQDFQAVQSQAAAFHGEFMNLLNGSAAAYLATDIASAQQANSADSLLGGLLGGLVGGGGTSGGTTTTTGGLGGLLGGSGGVSLGSLGGLLSSPLLSIPIPNGPTLGSIPPIFGGLSIPPIFAGPVGDTLGNVLSVFLNGGGTSLLTNPSLLTNALSPIISDVPGLQPILQGLLPGLFGSPPSTTEPAPPLNPYVALWDHTTTNLGLIGANMAAHPFPVPHQIGVNQSGYAQLVAQALQNGVQSFPGGLQVLPGQIEAAIQTAEKGFNPIAFIDWFGANRDAYGTLINTSLANAGQQFQTTIPIFQADAAEAWHQVTLGNFNTAVSDYSKSAIDLFISGFDTSQLVLGPGSHIDIGLTSVDIAVGFGGPIGLEGPAGALLPILTIPGLQTANFAALMPQGSSIQHIAQNFANYVGTITNTSVTTTAIVDINGTLLPPSLTTNLNVNANFGLPLQLAFAVLGTPFAQANGVATVLSYLGTDIQTGNGLAFAGAILDAPAIIMDSTLNGQTFINLSIPVTVAGTTLPLVMQLPLQGLLVPPQTIDATIDLAGIPIEVPVGGSTFGGLLPLLMTGMPLQLAAAIA